MVVATTILDSDYRSPCMLKKTAIFIHKVSLLIFPRVGKQSGFARARTNVGESLSVGAMSQVMVTRAQTWCEI
ncbi:hypothetical protein HanPSC8_Chr01g0029431 [Helianthus annuus]|nr:hypothetical protein HanPSC8_Chr01g0029431 [Helianthus annuus]